MAPDLCRRFPLNTKHPTGNVALWISQKGHHVFVIFLSNPMPSGTARKRNPSVCGCCQPYLVGPVVMLWTAPPRHESAIEVGAVKAPHDSEEPGLCKRS